MKGDFSMCRKEESEACAECCARADASDEMVCDLADLF